MKRKDFSLRQVFATPLLIGMLGLTGLIAALLEDGAWDLLGAALLAAAVVSIVWARLAARK